MDYRTFLNQKWGKGAASNATRAAAWRRLNPPTPRAAAPAVPAPQPPPTPTFTPGALDESGVQTAAQLRFDRDTQSRAIQGAYDDTMGEINAQQPLLAKARDDGYQSVDRNAAGRGVFRSGIRQQNRTNVGESYDNATRELQRSALRAANQRQRDLDAVTGQFGLSDSNNTINANIRQRQAWEEANPVVATVAPTQPTPEVKYKDWLKGRRSTANMAAAWRRSQGLT